MAQGNGEKPATRPSTPEEARRGKTDLVIGVEQGLVIVRFPQPMAFLAIEAENARRIAEGIAAAAYEAYTGNKPPPLQSELARQARDRFTETVRVKLINRVAAMLNSESFVQMAPKDRALRVVDQVMKELA